MHFNEVRHFLPFYWRMNQVTTSIQIVVQYWRRNKTAWWFHDFQCVLWISFETTKLVRQALFYVILWWQYVWVHDIALRKIHCASSFSQPCCVRKISLCLRTVQKEIPCLPQFVRVRVFCNAFLHRMLGRRNNLLTLWSSAVFLCHLLYFISNWLHWSQKLNISCLPMNSPRATMYYSYKARIK